MGFLASAGLGMAGKAIGGLLGGSSAKKAEGASNAAAGQSIEAQREALQYLQDEEALPSGIRENALTGLSQYFTGPAETLGQEGLIDQARNSPLYAAILGQRGAGEDAILRNASATGGLRSGNSNAALTDYNMQLENKALLDSYNEAQGRQDYERQLQLSGLGGLANLPSNANNIAERIAGIGSTRAAGTVAGAQARQDGSQNIINNAMGIGKTLIENSGTVGKIASKVGGWLFCDIRLKRNIREAGERNGHKWYQWEWCDGAEKLGLSGTDEGVLAHQVYEIEPDAVGENSGFLVVDYEMLGIDKSNLH